MPCTLLKDVTITIGAIDCVVDLEVTYYHEPYQQGGRSQEEIIGGIVIESVFVEGDEALDLLTSDELEMIVKRIKGVYSE